MDNQKINNTSIYKCTHIDSGESNKDEKDKMLCELCGRTSDNGIRCLGMCVAESDY